VYTRTTYVRTVGRLKLLHTSAFVLVVMRLLFWLGYLTASRLCVAALYYGVQTTFTIPTFERGVQTVVCDLLTRPL